MSTSTTSYPAPPSINLVQRQIMLSFAYLAYTGEGLTTPDPCQEILDNINAALPQIPQLTQSGGNTAGWKIAWGPAAYTVPGSLFQDNMMYVAQNINAPEQYVIAVRGTNFASEVDWLLEDFNVLYTVCWPLGATTPAPAGAMMTESTSIDLNILLSMQDTVNTNSQLLDFLLTQTAKPINVCVTGHSLGGALASSLALYLLENQASPSNWDQSGTSTVTFVSFAAPTAGNSAFAAYSNTTFAAATRPPSAIWDSTLNTNGDVVECAYDIAPMFYTGSNIYSNGSAGPLFSIYGSNIDFGKLKWGELAQWDAFQEYILAKLAGAMTSQDYTQLAINGSQIPGIFNGTPPSATSAVFKVYIEAFLAQAVWQHSNSYPNIFGLATQLLDPAIIVRSVLSLTQLSAATGTQGSTVAVTITGTCFSNLNNVAINAGTGITVTETNVVSDTQMDASFAISSNAPVGANNVVVSGISGIGFVSSNSLPFTITAS